jgi:hypothetical protein
MIPRLLGLLLLTSTFASAAVSLSQTQLQRVGQRIWQNECAGTVAGLTSWNAGEDFASLGIGHFIWYPAGKRGPFEESFPGLVQHLARIVVMLEHLGVCVRFTHQLSGGQLVRRDRDKHEGLRLHEWRLEALGGATRSGWPSAYLRMMRPFQWSSSGTLVQLRHAVLVKKCGNWWSSSGHQ